MNARTFDNQLNMINLHLPAPLLTVFPEFGDRLPLLKDILKQVIVQTVNPCRIIAYLPENQKETFEALTLESPKAALNAIAVAILEVDFASFDLILGEDTVAPPATKPTLWPSSPAVRLPSSEPAPQARSVKTHNKLTTVQQIALTDWLRANEAAARKESDPKLAELASVALEFTVTPPNLTSIRTALGFEKTKPDTPPTIEEQLADLRRCLSKMTALVHHNLKQGTLTFPDNWAENNDGYFEDLQKILNPAA